MVMSIPLALKPSYVNAVMIYFIFAAWAALTISILVLMEGLSAFLHTLRKFELGNVFRAPFLIQGPSYIYFSESV